MKKGIAYRMSRYWTFSAESQDPTANAVIIARIIQSGSANTPIVGFMLYFIIIPIKTRNAMAKSTSPLNMGDKAVISLGKYTFVISARSLTKLWPDCESERAK